MDAQPTRIVLVDLRIPFFRLVMFFVKATLAAIPAALIVGVVIALAGAVVTAMLGGHPEEFLRRWAP